MLVIVTENAPPRLRGRLSLWLREVRAGVYVGQYGARIRERIWKETRALMSESEGSAILIWSAPTECGFRFDTIGDNRRVMAELDGLPLVQFASNHTD